MRRIDWLDFMSVDGGPWDAGRRGMLETLNRLADPATARDEAAARETVGLLADAAARQFAIEEADMAEARYPLVLQHRHRHQLLSERIALWRGRVDCEWRVGTGANLFLTLAPLLFRHFCDDDLRFARFRRAESAVWRRAA